MKNFVLVIFCLGLSLVSLKAQPHGGRGPGHEQIEAARIAFITEQLNITPEQAQQFWPIFNQYEDQRDELRRSMRGSWQQIRDAESLSDAEAEALVHKLMDMRQKELDLEKAYTEKVLKVLTPQQVVQLDVAEERFKRMVLERLREQRGERDELRREGRGDRPGGHQERDRL